jgi:hypothetical protein
MAPDYAALPGGTPWGNSEVIFDFESGIDAGPERFVLGKETVQAVAVEVAFVTGAVTTCPPRESVLHNRTIPPVRS